MNDFLQDELRSELRQERNWFRRWFRKIIPRKFRKILLISLFALPYLLFFLGLKEGIVNLDLNVLIEKFSNTGSGIQVVGNNNSVVLAEKTQCLSRYCNDFEGEKWTGIDNFVSIQTNPLILKSPNSAKLPGATMYYKEQVGNFVVKAFVTPQATVSANLVIAYGSFYRCIIGDSDFKQVTCQINEIHPKKPEEWAYFDQNGSIHGRFKQFQTRPFESNREMELKFEQREDASNTIISIKINDQVPAEWIIPKKYQKKTLREIIGLGLITNKQDDAQAIFKHFELDPKL